MKRSILKTLAAILAVQSLYFVGASTVFAQEMTCPEHTPVTVDIKPGDYLNKINLSSKGVVAVAVLSTEDFDASLFTPEEAHLSDASIAMTEGCGGATAIRSTYEDVNRDGQLDLIFFFKTRELNLTSSSTAATLMAHGTYDSTALHIMGTDLVVVKP